MKLYNTLSKKVELFTPRDNNQVSLYTCGPTVYDYLHIGNWAAYIRWDILARTLVASGYNLQWVMNITDVGHLVSDADDGEDKLEKGAKREGKSAWQVADFYTQDFLRGLKALHIQMDKCKLVKATDHIQQQIDLIKKLEQKGFVYKIADGMYFDTSKLSDYGKLARLDIKGLKAGARVKTGDKHNLTDFALWKFSPKGTKRDMEWESPWGTGFPGWHIECSAMSMQYLGPTIDIHTGGIDHIPVHHTNEIAQSEAATEKPFVRYWLHSNFLKVAGEKIAKSLGNGITLQQIVEKGFIPADVRMLVLQSHYRTEANFTWDILQAAKNRRMNWQQAASLRWQPHPTGHGALDLDATTWKEDLLKTVQNDLATPEALALIDTTMERVLALQITKNDLAKFTEILEYIYLLLGVDLFDEDITDDQKHQLQLRQKARTSNDWAESDRIRKVLASQHIGLNDTPEGQVWLRI